MPQMTTSIPITKPAMPPALFIFLCPVGAEVGVEVDDARELDVDGRVVVDAVDDTGTEEVAVLLIVLCPITVCKLPWDNENTFFPAAQFARPFSASGLQAKTLFPQGTSVPSLSFTGSSAMQWSAFYLVQFAKSFRHCNSLKQNPPHTVEFHRGFVQVPRIVVPVATVRLTAFASVTTQSLFEKQAHPVGQQRLVTA